MLPTPLQVLRVVGDQADLAIPMFKHGTDNPLRVPAADLTADTGIAARDLPDRHFTAVITQTPEDGLVLRAYSPMPTAEPQF